MDLDEPLFDLDDVSFSYPDGTIVFDRVNLTVNRGDFVALLAPNGGGKSTIMKLMCGLLEPDEGSVTFAGRPVSSYSDEELYSQLGFVFQNPDDQLFGATVKEDIAFGPRNLGLDEEEIQKRVRQSLEDVDLDIDVNKPVHRLSFGQRKRVALAGVLAMGVDTLLLDEPTGELDPLGQQKVFGLLKELNQKQNKTVILATHHLDLLGGPDETICVLSETDRIDVGSPREIFMNPELLHNASLRPPIALSVCRELMEHEGFDPEHTSEAQEDLWTFLEDHFWKNE